MYFRQCSILVTCREVSAQALPGALRERVTASEVPVEGLPAGLVLSRADVVPTGLRITADGTNVVVPQTTTG